MLVVPGMGSIRGVRCSCHASAICCSGGVVLGGDRVNRSVERPALVASGDGGRVPGGKDDPGVLGALPQGGAEADGDVVVRCDCGDLGDRRAVRNCSALTLESPMCRMRPSWRISASVPICSSNGTSVAVGVCR